MIRICEVDFGAKIDIDVASIRKHPDTSVSTSHCAVGTIHYDDGTTGYLIYMKSSLTADAETAVLEYKASHPHFLHETTADQFFSDDQIESYRMLGCSIAARTFRDINPSAPFLVMAENLCNLWTPNLTKEGKFVGHAKALTELWSKLQSGPQFRTSWAMNFSPGFLPACRRTLTSWLQLSTTTGRSSSSWKTCFYISSSTTPGIIPTTLAGRTCSSSGRTLPRSKAFGSSPR